MSYDKKLIQFLLSRWVIESVNRMLKKCKAFTNVFPNNQIQFIGAYLRIICAICNAYRPPQVFDQSNDSTKAAQMKACFSTFNSLKDIIESNNLSRKPTIWETVTDASVPNFPKLSLCKLQNITFGVYQVR